MHGSAFPRGVLDRRDDVVIGTAAAEVAAHPVADLLSRLGMALGNAGDAGHDLTRGAVTALESVALDEGGLQRMEPVALRQALDRGDLAPFGERRERETRFH